MVGFDASSRKDNLHIVSAVMSVDLPNDKVVFIHVNVGDTKILYSKKTEFWLLGLYE